MKDIKLWKGETRDYVNKLISDYIYLEDDVYMGNQYKHHWRCKCGNIIKNRTWAEIRGRNSNLCNECILKETYKNGFNNTRIPINSHKNIINKIIKEYILLEDEIYLGNTYKHNWRCLCGNLIEGRQWNNIKLKNQILCKECRYNEKELRYKTEVEKDGDYEYIRSYRMGDILPNGKIVNNVPYIQVRHKNCGSVYEITATDFINNKRRCSNCCSYDTSFAYHIEVELGEPLDKYWDFERNTVNPYLINKYRNGKNKNGENLKVWIRCDENDNHESYEVVCNNFVNKRRCPQCASSKGEKRIKEYLDKNNIDYTAQKTFDKLLGLGGGKLSYDFYLPDYNLLIEYQGEFHDGTAYQQTEEEFKYQQEHDRRKREYTKEHNIRLLEIWYYDFDNIENILNKRLY